MRALWRGSLPQGSGSAPASLAFCFVNPKNRVPSFWRCQKNIRDSLYSTMFMLYLASILEATATLPNVRSSTGHPMATAVLFEDWGMCVPMV